MKTNISSCCNKEVVMDRRSYANICSWCGKFCNLASPKASEIFEGENSSLRKTFDNAVELTDKEWDMRDVDGAIMDFQIHVRKVTGGNDYACVDSTELKKAIKGLLSTKEKEAYEKGRQSVLDEMEEEMRKFREGFSYRKK